MELDKVDSITITIPAIVHDHAIGFENSDIRPEHLSFDKFCSVLELGDPNFDFSKKEAALTWEVVLGSGQTQQKEIRDERGFQLAVGVLAWAATKDRLDRVLLMHIRPHSSE